jgi:hypothetical protein
MNTKGLQLASRFALPPNSLGYCGKGTAPEKFKACILKGNCTDVPEEVDKFIVLGPYLKTLAKITGKHRHSYNVVEAYWLGNSQLHKAKDTDYNLLLENFSSHGVPPWFIDELKEKHPKKFIPTHLFQILHVGVGKASGAVPFNISSINNCMIRWGKVKKIGKSKLTLKLNSLKRVGKSYKLTLKKGSFTYRADFLLELKVEDNVAVHWKQVVKILTQNEVKRLEKWTKKVIENI